LPKSPFATTRQLFVPVERTLFPEIDIPDQQDGDINQHLEESIPAHADGLLDHIAIDVRPRVQEDCFHVEQNKDHGHKVEFYGKRFASIACGFHAAFVSLLFGATWAAPSYQDGSGGQRAGKGHSQQQVYEKGSVRM